MKKLVTIMASASFAIFGAVADTPKFPELLLANGMFESCQPAHNMQLRRDAVAGGVVNPFKPLKSVSVKKAPGFKINSKVRRHADAKSSAIMFESFESCKHESDVLPAGWTSMSKGEDQLDAIDHWIGISRAYASYFMFPTPTDGDMMLGIYYNDDYYKDEWVVSPKLAIPENNFELSFDWYTRPMFLYAVDRYHVDFDKGIFTNREVISNFQVLIKADGEADWTVAFDLEKNFSNVEYYELSFLDYDVMQHVCINLDSYVGKTVQFAFRYYGEGGNTLTLDSVCVDKPAIEVSYMPHYSRLFYGFSGDEFIRWMPNAIEFYPVNHPVYWENSSPVTRNIDFTWTYSVIDDLGRLVEKTSKDDVLAVTYPTDYSSPGTLRNNFYPMPKLSGVSRLGGSGSFTHWVDFLQAGGTTEYEFEDEEEGNEYIKFTATPFDVNTEGYGIHFEEDESLGFYAEPIFGYTENTDAWWLHYSYPNGVPSGDTYAYVDGFANMYIPHPTATLVVNGVSAWGYGTISDDAEFTLNIYNMDLVIDGGEEYGLLNLDPIATKKLKGSEIIKVPSGLARPYLMMNFQFDEPVEFGPEGTAYGYLVMVSGYHNDKVEYFAPIQSMVPNEYEWCLGFYRYCSPAYPDLNYEISSCSYFKDFHDRDLFTSFAIGLDAHYPWLETAPGYENPVVDDDQPSFYVRGYYTADKYTVKAPDWLDVKISGRYNATVTVKPLTESDVDRVAPITISAPGVKPLTINVTVKKEMTGVGTIIGDDNDIAPVYNLQGIKVLDNAAPSDVNNLPAGIYIHNGRKIYVK